MNENEMALVLTMVRWWLLEDATYQEQIQKIRKLCALCGRDLDLDNGTISAVD